MQYRGSVPIGDLGMVDDQILVAPYGTDSVICHLNTMSSIMKFVFRETKCHTLNIGEISPPPHSNVELGLPHY